MPAIVASGTMFPWPLRILICLMSSIWLRKFGVGLHVHLPGPAEPVEVVDVERAQVHLQRVEDLADRDAHRLGGRAVDVEIQPGRVGPEAGEDVLECRACLRPASTTSSAVSCRASRPVSPRSSTTILKPPAVPRPSTGGALKTLTTPSSMFVLQSLSASGRRSRRPRGPWRRGRGSRRASRTSRRNWARWR